MAYAILCDDVWNVIRVAYETTEEPVAAIAGRFGISKSRIYDRAAREKWKKRSDRTRLNLEDVAPADVPPPSDTINADTDVAAACDADRPAETHAQRLERLHRIVDRLLARLERTMERNHTMSPQDQEKTARAMTQTVAVVERLTELSNAQGQPPETSDGGKIDERADAERMRREIAERLERLGGKPTDGATPGKPQ